MVTLEKYNVKYVDDFVEFINDFQKNGDEFHMLSIIEDVFNLYFNTNKTYKKFTEGEIREFFPRYVEFILNCETREKIESAVKNISNSNYAKCKDYENKLSKL